MRILGIDPGLNVTGYGVLQAQGQRLHYEASGAIRVAGGALPERLRSLFEGVSTVAREAAADIAVVEIVFVNVNPQSTLLLGQARGAAIAALVACGLPVAEYTALQLKKAVVGHGRATKAQMQQMVTRLLGLPGEPGPDAADALGLAICHAQNHATASAWQRGQALPADPAAAHRGRAAGSLSAGDLRSMRVRRGRLLG